MKAREVVAEVFFWAGVTTCAFGIWQWSPPAAIVLFGLVLAFFGWTMASPRLARDGD